jgi:hypothetical protein
LRLIAFSFSTLFEEASQLVRTIFRKPQRRWNASSALMMLIIFSASVIGLEWSDSVALISQQQTMGMSSAGQSQPSPRTSE